MKQTGWQQTALSPPFSILNHSVVGGSDGKESHALRSPKAGRMSGLVGHVAQQYHEEMYSRHLWRAFFGVPDSCLGVTYRESFLLGAHLGEEASSSPPPRPPPSLVRMSLHTQLHPPRERQGSLVCCTHVVI